MKKKSPSKKQKKIWPVLFTLIAVVALLVGAAVFLYAMKVTEIDVKGLRYSDRDTVVERVFAEEDDYRLYRVILRQWFGAGEMEAFSKLSVRLTGFQSAEISIEETEAVCRLSSFFLNRNGIVLGDGAGNPDELMAIQGLTILSAEELKPIEVNEPAGLYGGMEVIAALKEQGIKTDVVYFDRESGTFRIELKNVTVLLGTETNIRAKAAELAGQLPALRGLSGTMHLEKYEREEDRKQFYFEIRESE